jgi:outer membrane murein-binding lipoprotein Lpp
MAYLGDKQRSEVIRFRLVLDAAPTGTPTISLTRGQGTALDTPISNANMTQGADTLEWYYDYTTESAAQVGFYTAQYKAVISGTTRYDFDHYDVTIYDSDTVKADVDSTHASINSMQTDVTSIETKVDTLTTKVNSMQTDVTSIESKTDIIDTNLDTVITDSGWDGDVATDY